MNNPIMPNAIISAWLAPSQSLRQYTHFEHRPLIERAEAREGVRAALSRIVFLYHNDPEHYRHAIAALGYPSAAQQLDRRPRAPKTRMGNFGEIIASEYLRQTLGYDIPVYRLRYNPNPESSMKGDDVLAFRFGNHDGSNREIVVGECKVRATYRRRAVVEAYKQLVIASRRPHPISLTFIANILRQEGQAEKADLILAFLNQFSPYPPRRRWFLFLATGNRPRDPFCSLQRRRGIVDNLIAVDLHVENLAAWVNRLFDEEIGLDEP